MPREKKGEGEKQKRHKALRTNGEPYRGVHYIEVPRPGSSSKTDRIYYINYYRKHDNKRINEKAGRESEGMTAFAASRLRGKRMNSEEDPTNKAKREALKVKEKAEKEAKEKAKAAKEAELNRWTLDRLWEQYKKQSKASAKGLATDDNRYTNHIKPVLGSKEPRELLPLDLERMKKKMKEKNPQVADGTVRNVLELLRRIVNFGPDMQLCPGTSFRIKLQKLNNERTEDLSPDELCRLLKALDAEKDIQAANFMRMALYTGLRRGELFKLKWEHVDFERGFIAIVDPKGGKDEKVPLNEMARKVLKSHPRIQGFPYVFPGRSPDKPRVDIKTPVNRVKHKAGLPEDFRPLHGLRHAYASMMASSGKVDMYTLQKLLTHKSPQMTMRYAHLRDEALKRASSVADDIFKKAAPTKKKG